jgi:plastocyanin
MSPVIPARLRIAGVLAAVPALAVGVLAVDGSAVAATSAQKRTVNADAHGALKFHPTRLTAKAGKVTIVMHNPSSSGMRHGIAVEGHGVDKDGKIVKAGKSSSVTASLKKGTYEFYCPVKGHKAAGMEGKIVVR